MRCTHCLEELDYLTNPKLLPCDHMFCEPCLENMAIRKQEGIEIVCTICR